MKKNLKNLLPCFAVLVIVQNVLSEQVSQSEKKAQNIQDVEKYALQGDSNAQCLLGVQEMTGGILYDPRIIDTVTIEQILLFKVEKWEEQIRFLPPNKNQPEIIKGDKTQNAFRWIKKSADQDNRVGLFALGRMYNRGLGIPKDIGAAFKCYKQSAELGFQPAYYYAGALCGRNDIKQAFEWYMRGYKANNVDCMAMVGLAIASGKGVDKDEEKGFKILEQSYKMGSKRAISALARCYNGGTGVKQNTTKGFSLAKEASDLDIDGKLLLGLMYLCGSGTEKDAKKGISLIEEVAATEGSPYAKRCLADAYANGWGVPINTSKALQLYNDAAQEDDSEAMYKLGEVYYIGSKVKGDRELAKSWLQKSKDKGNKDAAALLSKIEQHQIKLTDNDPEALYKEGTDILDEVLKGKLPMEGIHLLEESANAGYQPAVARLGYEYERGRHVKKDITKAKEYFLEASKSNNIQALSGLGRMYLNGDGVPQNREIAFDYFKKASELGSICDKENVALCFFMGYGVKQDFKRALTEYLNVINYDSFDVTNTESRSQSLTNIGYIYSFILKDRIEGNRWFSKAISIENPYDEAYYYLGMAFWLGEGVDQNKEKGIELLKTGRSKGNAKCVEALKSFNLN